MLRIILLFLLIFLSKNTKEYKLDGIYRIMNIYYKLNFGIREKKIILTMNNKFSFRIINIKDNSYYITSIFRKLKLGINNYNEIILDKIEDKNNLKFQWNIIKIGVKKYVIIQNKYNNKIIEINNKNIKLKDANNLIINNQNFFLFFKLFEEYKYKYEFSKNVFKEPIDMIIKYIDLNDKTLNRTGIIQTYKDADNEELRYSLRSIFQYIPWVRKIYILMPNKFVKYLKSIDEINEKIIFINDKNLLGFDSANIQSFLFNLYKMENFGISKNFIYMEDDYFIGNKLSKLDYFYYEEKEKKVVPFIISFKFYEINKTLLFNNYFNIKNKEIDPHSNDGFKQQIYNTEKFILEQYSISLIKAIFTHNSIPENIDDLKEIFNISNKYEYMNATILSKHRHTQSLCHQHFLNVFSLNVKHRKVHLIYSKYYRIENLNKNNLNKHLFVINTGGNHKPLYRDYKIQKKIMRKRFTYDFIYEKKDRNNNFKFFMFFMSIFKSIFKIYIIFFLIKINYHIIIFYI